MYKLLQILQIFLILECESDAITEKSTEYLRCIEFNIINNWDTLFCNNTKVECEVIRIETRELHENSSKANTSCHKEKADVTWKFNGTEVTFEESSRDIFLCSNENCGGNYYYDVITFGSINKIYEEGCGIRYVENDYNRYLNVEKINDSFSSVNVSDIKSPIDTLVCTDKNNPAAISCLAIILERFEIGVIGNNSIIIRATTSCYEREFFPTTSFKYKNNNISHELLSYKSYECSNYFCSNGNYYYIKGEFRISNINDTDVDNYDMSVEYTRNSTIGKSLSVGKKLTTRNIIVTILSVLAALVIISIIVKCFKDNKCYKSKKKYSFKSEDAFSHREDAFSHREDAFSHRKDAFSHREDAFSHRKDAFSHREDIELKDSNTNDEDENCKDVYLHREDVSLHHQYVPLHRKDAFLHRKDASLHRKDASLHRKDAFLHRKDAYLHRQDAYLHRQDASLHREYVSLHRQDAFFHSQDVKSSQDASSHREDVSSHREDSSSHREDASPEPKDNEVKIRVGINSPMMKRVKASDVLHEVSSLMEIDGREDTIENMNNYKNNIGIDYLSVASSKDAREQRKLEPIENARSDNEALCEDASLHREDASLHRKDVIMFIGSDEDDYQKNVV